MISQLKAHPEYRGEKQQQVLHLWEGEVKPHRLGESSARSAKKVEQLQELQSKVVSALQKHLDLLWGKDKVLQSFPAQQLSFKDFFSGQKVEDLLVVSWGTGAEALRGYLVVERSFFYFLYSFIFGGNRFVSKSTPLSKLEKNYFGQFVQDLLEIATNVWKGLGAYSIQPDKFFVEAESISKIYSPNDFILVRFEVASGESKYGFSMLYPMDLLAAFDENKVQEGGAALQFQRDEEWEASVLHAVSVTVSAKVHAELGTVPLLLSEALSLQVGQVLPLKVNDKGHPIYINGSTAFLGKMGSIGESRAVQIIENLST
ncbi:MAG: FliM/FliN family flagellar motor switch protein [Deltaproteobacteria bacterium]|nr:FliM/FliN family flagellar motor switch protein [Deltaproteobacteria bacterium]